jgi:hypothetical protein
MAGQLEVAKLLLTAVAIKEEDAPANEWWVCMPEWHLGRIRQWVQGVVYVMFHLAGDGLITTRMNSRGIPCRSL